MTNSSRLQSFSNELANLFSQADLSHKHIAALSACLFSIKLNRFIETEVREAVQSIKNGIKCDVKNTYALLALADKYDNLYFLESENNNEEISELANTYFLKARSLTALNIYLSENDNELDEVLYESLLSTEKTNELLNLIIQSLTS